MSWLVQRAFGDEEFRQHGGELWRNFKLALSSTVDSFNEIYTKPSQKEFEVSARQKIDDKCFRVRSIPLPGENERVIEVWLKPAKHLIEISRINGGGKPIMLSIATGNAGLELRHGDQTISVEEASQMTLEDFLFPDGIHREPLNPPKPDLPTSW